MATTAEDLMGTQTNTAHNNLLRSIQVSFFHWRSAIIGAVAIALLLLAYWAPWKSGTVTIPATTSTASTSVVPAATSPSSTLATLADVKLAKVEAELAATKQLMECLSQPGLCAVKK